MAKQTNVYWLRVDGYRRASRQRNTAGAYLVAASSEQKAITLLRERIEFGSIDCQGTVPVFDGKHSLKQRKDSTDAHLYRVSILAGRLRKNDVFRLKTQPDGRQYLEEPRNANDPLTA